LGRTNDALLQPLQRIQHEDDESMLDENDERRKNDDDVRGETASRQWRLLIGCENQLLTENHQKKLN